MSNTLSCYMSGPPFKNFLTPPLVCTFLSSFLTYRPHMLVGMVLHLGAVFCFHGSFSNLGTTNRLSWQRNQPNLGTPNRSSKEIQGTDEIKRNKKKNQLRNRSTAPTRRCVVAAHAVMLPGHLCGNIWRPPPRILRLFESRGCY